GAYKDDDGGGDRGAIYTLFLNIANTSGSLTINAHPTLTNDLASGTGTFNLTITAAGTIEANGDIDIIFPVGFNLNGVGASDVSEAESDGGTLTTSVNVLRMTINVGSQINAGTSLALTIADVKNPDVAGSFGTFVIETQDASDGVIDTGTGNAVTVRAAISNYQKISDTAGNFTGVLDNSDVFGAAVAGIGDLDGDGINDILVGAQADDDGGTDRGAVYILFLNTDGTVSSEQKISDTAGGFTTAIDNDEWWGRAITSLGDVDSDGINDIAVGAYDADGGTDRGAVYILFLNTDGTVSSEQKISDTIGEFTGVLDNFDEFGIALAGIGDLDGDGINDLAVGALSDDDGGSARGAIYVLFLNTDGTVSSEQKISDTTGGFTGVLDNNDWFGRTVSKLGDLDGDGVPDLAVGAYNDDDGGADRGAVYVLFMNTGGTVNSFQKISDTVGGFTAVLDNTDYFGAGLTAMDDLDGNGARDLAVTAYLDDDGGADRGAVYILYLTTFGTVDSYSKLSETSGGLGISLENTDRFGFSISNTNDINEDGNQDIAVGTFWDDDGGTNRGAVYIFNLNNHADNTIGTLTIDSHPALSSSNFSAPSSLTITFTTENTIPANGDIDIIFPVGFDLSAVGSGDVSEADSDGGTLTTSVNGHRMTINTGTGTAGGTQFALTINNLTNPINAGSYGTFAIETQDENNAVIDQGTGNSVTISSITPSYLVTKTNDTNNGSCEIDDCSLREAITAANSAGGSVTITFDITTCNTGACTISPASALPSITADGITINGYSQSYAAVNTASFPNAFNGSLNIIIDGASAGAGADGLSISGAKSTVIKGLVINNFGGEGIYLDSSSSSNHIQGNYIGVGFDGTSDEGNTANGIYLDLSADNIIGSDGDGSGEAWERNLIAANDSYGIYVSGTTTKISGNFLGVSFEGSEKVSSAGGIYLNSSYAQIGTDNDGTDDTTEGNIISGHTGTGIYVTGAGATANTIAGNYIGVGYDGTLDLGNDTHGIWLLNSTSDNTIGGSDGEAKNIIAYNGDAASEYGVFVDDVDTDRNHILYNQFLSNQNEGIKLAGDGANNDKVKPTILKKVVNGSSLEIIGTVYYETDTVHLYDASVDFEGETYLGEDVADANGTWTVILSSPYTADGNVLVATASNTFNDTSEFTTNYYTISNTLGYEVTKVDDTNDGVCNADCSLREAITAANAAGGNVTISFDVTSCYTSICLFEPNSALPSLTANNITIDGYTQSGAVANTADWPNALNGTLNIVIDGGSAGAGAEGLDLDGASNSTVKGLVINNFGGEGVYVHGGGTNIRIEGNYIGVWFEGTSDKGNTGSGVYINDSSGNYVGTDGDGSGDAAERNLIAGNSAYGIRASGTTTQISGNFIGVTYEGSVAISSGGDGIYIDSSYNIIGTDNDGGVDSTEGNIISSHVGSGIYITGAAATANTIAGNYIGVGFDGSLDLGNGLHGIWILNAANDNTIGGMASDTVNIVAHNGDAASEYGIYIDDADTDQNRILRNSIFANENEGIKLAFDGANDDQIPPAIIKNEDGGSSLNI
ncbi:hypothetical protein BVY03_04185, partial [bacterium K02(2017)]